MYEHTVPRLAAAIAARHEGIPEKAALEGIYHAALTDTDLSGVDLTDTNLYLGWLDEVAVTENR